MVSIRHNGRSYSVLFQSNDNVLRLDKHGFENVGRITALILDENQHAVAAGTSVRAERDEEDDYKGMKLALARAVKFTEDRDLRAKFHDAFHTSVIGEHLRAQEVRLHEIQQQRLQVRARLRRMVDGN